MANETLKTYKDTSPIKEYNVYVQPKYGVQIPVQPKYGVQIPVQPKYGVVVPSTGPTPIQPKYGVVVPSTGPTPIQPKYGVITPTPGQDISITFSQLEENIATLKKSIASLKSSWDGETKNNLDTLNNSWVGADCAEYTAKLSKMDKKVQNTIAALELLCSTYEQARDMVKDNQATAISSISNIN